MAALMLVRSLPAVQNKLKDAEGALALLDPPDPDLAGPRSSLTQNIASMKATLRQGQPNGAHLDAARGAMQRTSKRLDAAAQTLELAKTNLAQASAELVEFEDQLRQVEKETDASIPEVVSLGHVLHLFKGLSGAEDFFEV